MPRLQPATSAAAARGRRGRADPQASLWTRRLAPLLGKSRRRGRGRDCFSCSSLYVVFAPIFSPYDPYAVDFSQAYLPPSWSHPLGTDQFGRDLFTRAALGGRISIGIGFAATIAIMGIGTLYGSISGFVGGKLDNALMRFLDTLYGLPYLPFAIITLAIVGTVNFWTMVVALTIASWFTAARVVRGQIITLKENDYVRAAHAVGARWYRILGRHLLPNTLGVLIVFVFLELPGVVLGEAFLSFIGLGINPPKASWGSLAQDGRDVYLSHPTDHRHPERCDRLADPVRVLHRRRPTRRARPAHEGELSDATARRARPAHVLSPRARAKS